MSLDELRVYTTSQQQPSNSPTPSFLDYLITEGGTTIGIWSGVGSLVVVAIVLTVYHRRRRAAGYKVVEITREIGK